MRLWCNYVIWGLFNGVRGVVNTLVMNKKHEKVFLKASENFLKSGFARFFLKIIAEKIRLFINRYSQQHAIYCKTCYCKRFPLFMYGIQKQPSYVAHLCHAGYILSIGFRAKPLISNRTIFDAKKPS